jgi:hypothetical protein
MALLINPYRFASAAAFDPLSLYQSGTYKGVWIDASDLSTLKQNSNGTTDVASDNDPVGYVSNKVTTSGGNLYRINSDDTARPLYKVSGGLSSLLFDGSNDGLLGSGSINTAMSGSEVNWTVVVVAKLASSGVSFNDMLYIITGSNNQYYQYVSSTSFGASQANVYTTVPTLTATNAHVVTLRYRADNTSGQYLNCRINGVDTDSGGTSTATLGTVTVFEVGNYGGGGTWFKGDLYQLYIINRNLTGSDLTSLESALAAKAGVTI